MYSYMFDFCFQEPGTDEEIVEFVKKYNVTFDMFHKIDVNGSDAHPVFKGLILFTLLTANLHNC